MPLANEILILADNRIGTYSQAIALAEAIGFPYRVINLQYGFFAKLPNFLLSDSILRLTKSSREAINSINQLPKLVISSGRRSAPIALYLKKKSRNLVKLVQIMKPELGLSLFDFVVLPTHDRVKKAIGSNVIATIGAMNRVNEKLLDEERQKFSTDFEFYEKPVIAMMIGGDSSRTKFEKESVEKLVLQVSQIAKNMKASLIILTSRRTGEKLTLAIKNAAKSANLNDLRLLCWLKIKDKNPYLAIIGLADYFVISGDSVSMISDCCSTGKPLYIFDEKKISTAKHRRFHQAVFDGGFGRKLSGEVLKLENYSVPKLCEAKRVANIISQAVFKT